MIQEKKEWYSILKNYYDEEELPFEELNIFGVRNEENQQKDIWNDLIGFIYKGTVFNWLGTTDPGRYWTEKKEGGVAHLCLGYHSKIWMVGTHGTGDNAHQALVQWGNKVKIWRDLNRDYIDNDNKYEEGYFGINFHSAMSVRDQILLVSAGCQVTRDMVDFKEAMKMVLGTDSYKKDNKYRFSYLLLDKTFFK